MYVAEQQPRKLKQQIICCLLIASFCFLSPQLALIVAQHRDKANNLSGIFLTALDEGLKKIYAAAKRYKGIVI